MFFLLPRRQSGWWKSFSAPIIAQACIGRVRGLHSVAAGRIRADVNLFTVTLATLSNHLAWKLSPFVSTLNFLTQEQKLKLHEMWGGGEGQIPADIARPVFAVTLLAWHYLPLSGCLPLTLCYEAGAAALLQGGDCISDTTPTCAANFQPLHFSFQHLKVVAPVQSLLDGGGAVELERRTSVIWAQLCFLPWMEWQLVMAGAP